MLQKYNKQLIANSFSQSATTYDKAAILQRDVSQYLFEKLKKLEIYPKVILDLGAGTGQPTQQLVQKFPKSTTIAVDLAFGMLDYAQQISSINNIYWLCADVDKLPFRNNACNLVFSNLMLQWSQNYRGSLREIWRILKPNGTLIFSTLGPETLKELRYCWQQVEEYPHTHSFIHSELLIQEISKYKPSYISVEVKHCYRYFYQAIDLMKELKMLGANNMQKNKHKGLLTMRKLQHVFKIYENFRDKKGLLPTTYEVYLILVTKAV